MQSTLCGNTECSSCTPKCPDCKRLKPESKDLKCEACDAYNKHVNKRNCSHNLCNDCNKTGCVICKSINECDNTRLKCEACGIHNKNVKKRVCNHSLCNDCNASGCVVCKSINECKNIGLKCEVCNAYNKNVSRRDCNHSLCNDCNSSGCIVCKSINEYESIQYSDAEINHQSNDIGSYNNFSKPNSQSYGNKLCNTCGQYVKKLILRECKHETCENCKRFMCTICSTDTKVCPSCNTEQYLIFECINKHSICSDCQSGGCQICPKYNQCSNCKDNKICAPLSCECKFLCFDCGFLKKGTDCILHSGELKRCSNKSCKFALKDNFLIEQCNNDRFCLYCKKRLRGNKEMRKHNKCKKN